MPDHSHIAKCLGADRRDSANDNVDLRAQAEP